MTNDEFCEVVRQTIAELPPPFFDWMENIVVDVKAEPSDEMLDEMGLDDKDDLFGVFDGLEVTEQEYGLREPNRILIFQRPLEAACRSRDELKYEIRRTVIHELAHHFGYSEEDLEDFESQPSPYDGERGGAND
jgi:predicted Zn-dependent protease with MMP-like domain